MAELLIRLKDNTHPDAVKDRMCYKRGDIVVVMPDGHQWGSAEGLPDFAVIRTDRTVGQMEKFIAVHEVEVTEAMTIPFPTWVEMKARRDYGLFTRVPVEGVQKISMVNYGTPRQRQITTITLTGPVLRPHTRRRWKVMLKQLPANSLIALLRNGIVVVPFAQLRTALRDKITGVTA